MPHPVPGSAPWDVIEEAEQAAEFALDRARLDALEAAGPGSPNILNGIVDPVAAQQALDLGGAATLYVGQDVGTVAAGDDPRIVGALQTSVDLLGVNPDNARGNINAISPEEVDAKIVEAIPAIGDPVDIIHGGTGANTDVAARAALSVYSISETDAAIAAHGGGSGTITSVNGQAGPTVTLAATDVGADATGTAAGLVATEAATRAAADTTNATAITTEATARASADTTLQTNITAEASTRASADTTNATAISTETTRATTAEALLAPKASPTFTGTVAGITASMVGLGSVDNTADTAKPVSTAQQTALNLKANLASPTFTGTVAGITSSMVGLGNVDNTSDATKNAASVTLTNKTLTSPVLNTGVSGTAVDVDSTFAANSDTLLPSQKAVKTAVALKAPLASPTFTGTVTIPSQAAITYPNFTDGFSITNHPLDIKARNYQALQHARACMALGSLTVLYGPGDSITEGSSLTNYYDRWTNRVTDVLANAITAQSPGVGYVPFATVNTSGISGASTPTSPVSNFFTQTGGTATLGSDGLGKRSWKSNTGSTSTKTATNVACDRFRIYYNKGSALGTFTVTVDGGAPATVDCWQAGAGPTMSTWDSSTNGGLSLTPGLHTIVVTTVNTGTVSTFGVNIAGVMFYLTNFSAGVRQFEASHPSFPSQVPSGQELVQIGLANPDLVFVSFGANDDAFAFSPTTTATNFKNIVTAINGVCTVPPSVVFLATWGHGTASTEATWKTYRLAIMQAAIETGAAFVDVYEALGWQGSSTTIQDGVAHPTAAGCKAYTQAIVDQLGLAVGQSADGAVHSAALSGGASWSIADAGTNGALISFNSTNSDQFAVAGFGAFTGGAFLGMGPGGNTFVDTTLIRDSAAVFKMNGGLKLAGLTGATSTGRFVGTTASVAPTTGTFAVGDYVNTQTGRAFMCTVAGSPGTWIEQGSPTFAPLASPTFTGTVTTAAITMSGALTLHDGDTVLCGTTTGTSFGSGFDKLSFYAATPITRPSAATDVLSVITNLGLRTAGGNPPLNLGTGVLTAGTTTLGATTNQLAGVNTQTGTTYTMVAGDASKIVTMNNASGMTLTIPANSSVAYAVGTEIRFYNKGAGTMTLAITTDTLLGTTSYAANKGGLLTKLTSTIWAVLASA